MLLIRIKKILSKFRKKYMIFNFFKQPLSFSLYIKNKRASRRHANNSLEINKSCARDPRVSGYWYGKWNRRAEFKFRPSLLPSLSHKGMHPFFSLYGLNTSVDWLFKSCLGTSLKKEIFEFQSVVKKTPQKPRIHDVLFFNNS